MKSNYDAIAGFYDGLSRMVFGKTLLQAQLFLLDSIPAGATVLIAGGGGGWILEAIAGLHPTGLKITYVDASAKMIALAKLRDAGNNEVTFVTAYIEEANLAGHFDIVITPFLFDNFGEGTARKIFSVLDKCFDAKGAWLYCDFRDTPIWWQRTLLKVMYLFFRLFCGVEASGMPDMAACFKESGYFIVREQQFIKGFVEAAIYKKG